MANMKVLIAGCSALALLSSPAWGQDQGGPGASSDLGEIIVTARKRQESILKVPVVETIVTKETIENYQINDIVALSTKVPGLIMGGSVLAIGPQIAIRGVGTSTIDPGVDQSVSLNLDGMTLTQGLSYKTAFFDIASIEVLKGPQSLFYGKNSPGGVVAVRSADPTDETELIARTGYEFEADEIRSELIYSRPLSDTVGLRLAGQYNDAKGFFRNKATAAPGLGGADPRYKRDKSQSYIARATLLWTPDDSLTARFKANIARNEAFGHSGQNQMVGCPDGTGPVPVPAPFGSIPFLSPNEECKLNRTYYVVDLDPAAFPTAQNGGVPFIDIKQKFGSLELNYDAADSVTVSSVTSYYYLKSNSLINCSSSGFAASGCAAFNFMKRTDFTQELRVDTDFASPLNGMFGVYYQDGEINYQTTLYGNKAILPSFFFASGGDSFERGVLADTLNNLDIVSYSVFGQLRYQVAEQLEIAGGVRWTDETRKDEVISVGSGTPVNIPLSVPKISSRNWSPELTITFTPTDDLTIFGSLKQGYKSGSFTIARPGAPFSDTSFGDEKVQGGELGLKARMLDRSMFLNLAGYYYKYKGLQVGTNAPLENGLPTTRTVNAGGAEVYGVDFDVTYRPRSIEGLTLNGAVNYVHGRFTTLDNVPCSGGQTIAQGCNQFLNPQTGLFVNQDLTGLRMVRAPDWTITGGFEYEMPVGSDTKLRIGGDTQYTSQYPATLLRRADVNQGSVAVFNANMEFSDADDAWGVALIANNIGNKILRSNCGASNYQNGVLLGGQVTGGTGVGPAGVDEVGCIPKRGRELWIRLTLRPTSL